MNQLNPPYSAPFAYEQPTAPEQPFVLAWLYWLRCWLGLCADVPLEDMESEFADAGYAPWEYERPLYLDNRRQRRWVSHYRRCGSEDADSILALRKLLPRGLSASQMQERLSRVSTFGRVAIYGISRTCCVRLRRPLLHCYDHGWWCAPVLCVPPESLHPP